MAYQDKVNKDLASIEFPEEVPDGLSTQPPKFAAPPDAKIDAKGFPLSSSQYKKYLFRPYEGMIAWRDHVIRLVSFTFVPDSVESEPFTPDLVAAFCRGERTPIINLQNNYCIVPSGARVGSLELSIPSLISFTKQEDGWVPTVLGFYIATRSVTNGTEVFEASVFALTPRHGSDVPFLVDTKTGKVFVDFDMVRPIRNSTPVPGTVESSVGQIPGMQWSKQTEEVAKMPLTQYIVEKFEEVFPESTSAPPSSPTGAVIDEEAASDEEAATGATVTV